CSWAMVPPMRCWPIRRSGRSSSAPRSRRRWPADRWSPRRRTANRARPRPAGNGASRERAAVKGAGEVGGERPQNGTPLLEGRDLVVHHGQLRALDGISFRVFPGEVYAIIGANGAGKSTLLRTTAGLHSATT